MTMSLITEQKRAVQAGSSNYAPPKRNVAMRRCSCGQCPECVMNARWERIFNEKFADPGYYTKSRVRYCSPIGDM
jgi:hypothetical protein